MPLVKIDNHVEQALARLISQYQDKPRIAALISIYAERSQAIEDALFEVLVSKLIDSAVNEQLKFIGRIVGQPNEGSWDDDTYRLFIKARIRANKSNGHGDDVIDVVNLVEAADFVLREYYPATMFVDFDTVTAASPVILLELARRAKGSGVRLQLLYGDHDVSVDGFSFCAGTTDVVSTTEGFALTDESTGGYLSGAIE
jgi:hypothetical protein